MRELKFRALDTSFNKKWVYGYYCFDVRYPDSIERHWVGYNEVYPETLGQFTGLKDRIGKDIYEGDIYIMGDKNIKYQVIFKNSSFIGNEIGNKSLAGLDHWIDNIEVIGNVHEAPELIN